MPDVEAAIPRGHPWCRPDRTSHDRSAETRDNVGIATVLDPSYICQDARRPTTHNVRPVIRPTPVRARRTAAQLVAPDNRGVRGGL